MDSFYTLLITIIIVLAIIDLIVGVSNDAVNFLNSAIGSKAFPVKTILIVASFGLALGAVFSSGLMEVARVGVFQPDLFSFHELMIVFISVMIADILLINFFNSYGIPTSTTVSIIFCLLGAAVAMGTIQIIETNGFYSNISRFINVSKTTSIVKGILLSIFLAFIIGAIVQFISRLLFTFQFENSSRYLKSVFAGFALSCIGIFVILRGFGTTILIDTFIINWITNHLIVSFISIFIICSLSAFVLGKVFKLNILKLIVLFGLFGLALSFAGNDLVNFIGVPVAAIQSFELFVTANTSTPVLATEFKMSGLINTVQTPYYILILAGIVMVGTLWISKRVFLVTETEINLARQNEGFERFKPHGTSRFIVKAGVGFGYLFNKIIPTKTIRKIDDRFQEITVATPQLKAPSFDLIRASVNLMVASVLISIATSWKLPLSTTYVTFMVAMGTALADRAWNRESAVYRVAGVLNVIASWLITSLLAFLFSGIIVVLIYYGGLLAILVLVSLLTFILIRSAIQHRKRLSKLKAKKKFNPEELNSIHEITTRYSYTISEIFSKLNTLFGEVIKNLGLLDTKKLKQNRKSITDIHSEIDILKEMIFHQINSKKGLSTAAYKFYILTLDDLQAINYAISQMIKSSYLHVSNNHKNLTFNQIRGLKSVDIKTKEVFPKINDSFRQLDFSKLKSLIKELENIQTYINDSLEQQIQRTSTQENGAKNMRLYFDLLKKAEDMIVSLMIILKRYKEFNDTPIDE